MSAKIEKHQEKWSIQISSDMKNILKTFCKQHGYKMSGFVEIAILSKISGSLLMESLNKKYE